MKGFFSSPRRRRRFFTFGSVAVVVGLVTFSMVHWSNTSHVHYAKTRPGKPTILAAPVHEDFRIAKREGVMRVAAEFVDTAVRRHNVAVSYDLATPNLRSGYTRRTWATQDIPVQPYPLDYARYKLMGSFKDSVWLEVAVYPDHAHKAVPAAVFDLTLKPFAGSGHTHHWLVDSWAPASYQGVPSGPLGSDKGPLGATSNVQYKSGLSNVWLLVPISGFILGFLFLIGLGARGWYRNSRAVKNYREHSL